MGSRSLMRWLLLAQALAAGAIGLLLVRHAGLQPAWLAGLAGVALVLLARLLITANNFVLSARSASPTPHEFRIGARARLQMLLEEYQATMLHSSWFMALAGPGERLYPGYRGAPVLLLHGYGCNGGYWTLFARRLDAAGISHAALDLDPLLGDIDGYAPLVGAAVDGLCARSGAAQVIIVAHSMGGLVARAYLRRSGPAQVARVITLGTPHHGTSLASFGIGKNAAQMRMASPARQTAGATLGQPQPSWLDALAASESASTRALITSIYTHHDNIVSPQTSSVLPGAHHIAFGGVGHVALGRNPRVLARLLREIGTCGESGELGDVAAH